MVLVVAAVRRADTILAPAKAQSLAIAVRAGAAAPTRTANAAPLFERLGKMKMEHEFTTWLLERPANVVLLEGTRTLPGKFASRLTTVALQLARHVPNAIFRSGNAEGSDTAFATGVTSVDPVRLQLVIPYAEHRRAGLGTSATVVALPDSSPQAIARLVQITLAASPSQRSLVERYLAPRCPPAIRMKARYILRDTLKVVGEPKLGLAPATCGLFFTHRASPDSGGTGHTIRVCRHLSVPAYSQDDWFDWWQN